MVWRKVFGELSQWRELIYNLFIGECNLLVEQEENDV